MRNTFRQSDIVGRIGGDEFGILAIEAFQKDTDVLLARLEKTFQDYNIRNDHRYQICLSVGVAYFDPATPSPIDQLITQADKALYEIKQRKKIGVKGRNASSPPKAF